MSMRRSSVAWAAPRPQGSFREAETTLLPVEGSHLPYSRWSASYSVSTSSERYLPVSQRRPPAESPFAASPQVIGRVHDVVVPTPGACPQRVVARPGDSRERRDRTVAEHQTRARLCVRGSVLIRGRARAVSFSSLLLRPSSSRMYTRSGCWCGFSSPPIPRRWPPVLTLQVHVRLRSPFLEVLPVSPSRR